MDLWDVVRLMLRRWIVAVPMLLATFAGTVWVGMHVKPDYTAEGNVSLLPPSVEQATVIGKSHTVNPWDTGTLTGAVVIKLRSKALHDSIAAEGFSSVFEADRDLQYPTVITVKVTASSEQAAQATVKRLLRVVADEATQQQKQYNLKPGEEITTIVVDDGSNVEPATGKIKRALIVVFGAGCILTIAVTVCIDALLRWRTRQRLTARQRRAAQSLGLSGLTQPGVGQSGPSVNGGAVNGGPIAGLTTNRPGVNGTEDETRPMTVSIRYQQSDVPVSAPGASGLAGGGIPVVRRDLSEDATSDSSPEATQRIDTRLEPVADDATIILPLSNAPWATGRKPLNNDHGTEVKPR